MTIWLAMLHGCVVTVVEHHVHDTAWEDWTTAPGDLGRPAASATGEGTICDRQVYGYEAATLSIEHATFFDEPPVRNDWDLLFGNDQQPGSDIFTVNTVVDDTSWIVDLCEVDSVADIPWDVLPGDHLEGAPLDDVPVVEGHTYVIRTRDEDTAQFAAVKVLEHRVDDSADIVWCRSVDPDGFEPDPSCLW